MAASSAERPSNGTPPRAAAAAPVVGTVASTTHVKGWTAAAPRAKSGTTVVHHPDAPRKLR